MSIAEDFESQLILRVPDELADFINELMTSGSDEVEEVELIPVIISNSKGETVTQFRFCLGKFETRASLIELPCVIESQKTIDNVNFFKSANVCQMVYVHPNNEPTLEDGKISSSQFQSNSKEGGDYC